MSVMGYVRDQLRAHNWNRCRAASFRTRSPDLIRNNLGKCSSVRPSETMRRVALDTGADEAGRPFLARAAGAQKTEHHLEDDSSVSNRPQPHCTGPVSESVQGSALPIGQAHGRADPLHTSGEAGQAREVS
jgi:hypothetical protein